ncbi:MAG: hypothetical protein ABW163_13410 [Luteimonas sp.]
MSSTHRTPRLRDDEPHALAALATALLLPALMALWLLGWRSGHDITRTHASSVVTRLVFIPTRAAPASVDTVAERTDAAPVVPPTPRSTSARRPAVAVPDATHESGDAATLMHTQTSGVALDYGNLLGQGEAPVGIAETLPWERAASRPEAAPERFRMRRQITPADVVRGFSQLIGLWPPGYTESPCPALRRTIDNLSQAPSLSTRDHALLQDAVLARSQYCA